MAKELPEDLEQPVPPEEPIEQQEPVSPGLSDRIQDAQDQYDRGKELYQKGKEKLAARAEKKAGKEGAKEGLKGVEKKGAEAAKRKVATRASQEAGKEAVKAAAGKTAAKVGASAVAKIAAGSVIPVIGNITMAVLAGLQLLWPAVKKYGKYAIYAVAVLLLLLAIPFGLLGIKSAPQYPATAAEKNQATIVAALAGNLVAGKQVTQKNVDDIKARYRQLVNLAKSDKKAEVEKLTNEIVALLDQLVGLNGEPQKTLLAKIKEKEKSLIDKYSELFAETGTCADLAPFLASGKFKVRSGPNGKNILKGIMTNASNQDQPASPDLCKALLVGLKAGYTISTDTFSYGHALKTTSGNRSLHWCGAAIDINYINGKHVDNRNEDVGKISRLWYEASQNGSLFVRELIVPSDFRQYGLKENRPKQYSAKIQGEHDDHIHLGGRIAAGACQ